MLVHVSTQAKIQTAFLWRKNCEMCVCKLRGKNTQNDHTFTFLSLFSLIISSLQLIQKISITPFIIASQPTPLTYPLRNKALIAGLI